MKKFIILFILGGLLIPAYSRLGDSPEEIEKRYGKPLEELKSTTADGKRFKYEFGNYWVLVDFYKGTSCREVIFNKDKTSSLSEQELRGMLKANQGSETNQWFVSNIETNTHQVEFLRSDSEAVGMYVGNIAPPQFSIVSVDYLDIVEQPAEPAKPAK